MQPSKVIEQLGQNKLVFESLLKNLDDGLILWKADPKKWCLLEIICHLVDEEVEDFRTRTKHALETPDLPLKSINPKGWPKERKYLDQTFDEVLKKFLFERQVSIEWLMSLQNPEWESFIENKELGKVPAQSFLHNWLAHDYHHIRQINVIKYDYLKIQSSDDLWYAGNW